MTAHHDQIEAARYSPYPTVRTTADRIPLRDIMSRELVCARPDLEISKVVWLMVRNNVGCVPVVDERRHPIGVITSSMLSNIPMRACNQSATAVIHR